MSSDRGEPSPQRFADGPESQRSRLDAPDAEQTKAAQGVPGGSTLAGALEPASIETARVFDTQIEIAIGQIAVLEAANHAGDHHASSMAASRIGAALRIAEQAVASVRTAGEARATSLERRIAQVKEMARPALEQAFTPSPAARREAVNGSGRTLWDREVAAWRAARGRADREAPVASQTTAVHQAAPSPPRGVAQDAGLPRLSLQRKESAGGNAAAGPVASAEPWAHMFGQDSTPVNKLGRVQAPKGRTLLQGPEPCSAPSVQAPLPFDAQVMVLRRTTQSTAAARWCYVIAPEHGAAGFCEERYLAIDPPEPRAKLHRVEGGETLGKIARDVYGTHIAADNDERLYVQGLYEANKDRAGIKLTSVQLSTSETWHRREAEEKTLQIYRGVQVLKGMSLWIPSDEFIQRLKTSGAITSGSSELSKAWRAAAEIADDAVEAAKYGAGFILGLLDGAWSAIVDLFKGAVEMIETIAQVLYHLVTANPGRIKDMLMKWVDKMQSAWEHRGQIADEFLKKWNAPSGWDRGQFQGEVLGWAMMTVLIIIVTAGEAAAASAGSLAARFPQVVKLLKTVDAVGDITTYLGGAIKGIKAARKVPEAAADIVKRKLGKSGAAAAEAKLGSNVGEAGPRAGLGAAHVHEETFSINRTYEASPKHTSTDRKVGGRKIAKEPSDGAAALRFSFQISPNSPRRIGIDPKHNEFVVFDRTGNKIIDKQVVGGVYHGHVRTWDELDSAMKNALLKEGLVEKGRIKVDPARWDLTP